MAVGCAFLASASPAFGQAGGSGTPTSQNFGTVGVGGTVAGDLCGFKPGASETTSVNGTGNLAGTVGANGCKHFTVKINSQTSGSLDDPVNVTLQCGTNTVTTTSGGGSSSGTFTLTCAAATPAAAPTSTVAFTGANILRWSLAAAVLLGIGALMVWGTRRRRPTLDQ
jgi:hypothetical protein